MTRKGETDDKVQVRRRENEDITRGCGGSEQKTKKGIWMGKRELKVD